MVTTTVAGRKSGVMYSRLRLMVLAPVACGLMGATGENSVFNCGVSGSLDQVTGPCGGDGGIACNTDGGGSGGSNPGGGGGGGTSDAGNGAPGALTLSVAALPSTTVAPGQDLLIAGTLTGGTAVEAGAVQSMIWSISAVSTTAACTSGMITTACKGSLPSTTTTTNVSTFGQVFVIPYTAYTSGDATTCEAEPAVGEEVRVTAAALDVNSNVVGAASLVIHVGCTALDVSPTTASAAPGGSDVLFTASQNGMPIDALWSVVPLGIMGDDLGEVVPGFDGQGDYMPPGTLPADVPAAMIVATDPSDPNVTGGAMVWLSFTPIDVEITTPASTVTSLTATTDCAATVSGTTDWEPVSSVTWSLTPPTGVTPVDISMDSSTGVLTISSSHVTVQEAGMYTITATSNQDTSKSASITVNIPANDTLTVTLSPGTTETVLPGNTLSFSEMHSESPTPMSYSYSTVWTLTPPMDGLSTLSSGGLFTAGAVQATTMYTVTATVTDATNTLVGSASATVTVTGPVGISLSSDGGGVIPAGLSATIAATLTNSDGGVTWALSPAPTSPFTGNDGGWVYIDPRSGETTYTLTATSTVDTTKSASTTIAVPADPNGLSGTITYRGTISGYGSKSIYPIYVSCFTPKGPPVNEGTAFVPEWSIADGGSPDTVYAYRIHADLCRGGVLAFMDVLGTGSFVYGADPYALQPAPTDGTTTLNLTLQDPPSATSLPSDLNPPVIDPDNGNTVVTGFNGITGAAVVTFTPSTDSEGLEWPQQYRIYYATDPLDAGSYLFHTMSAGTFATRFISEIPDGGWFFAVQAEYTPYPSGTTVYDPPLDAGLLPESAWYPSYPVDGGGGGLLIPPPAAGTISGEVDLSELEQPDAGLTSSRLRVLAYDSTSGNIEGVASTLFDPAGVTTVNYSIEGLPEPDGGTYDIAFFVDWQGLGYLLPIDYMGEGINQTAMLETFVSGTSPQAMAFSLLNVPPTTLESTYNINTPQTLAYAMSMVQRTAGDSSVDAFPLYVVTPGFLPLAQVTRQPWVWDDMAQDLVSNIQVQTPTTPQNNSYFAIDGVAGSTPLVAGSIVPFFVQYADTDATIATVTATLHDSLSTGLAESITPENMSGEVTSEAPTFSWTAPTLSAPLNFIDHYDLIVQEVTSDMPVIDEVLSGDTTSYTASDVLVGSETYNFVVAAVDRYGDVEVMTGVFSTSASPTP